MLLVEAIDHGFVADAAHEGHEHLQVSVFVAYVFIEARLEEGVEALRSDLRLTLAVQDTEKVELIDSESQGFVLLETFLFAIVVRLVVENDEDVILHQ